MKENTKTRIIQWVVGLIMTVALILVLLISSFEIAAYSNFDFYEKEYEKYGVLEEVQMEMKEVMYVTREMMDYLKGNRENLIVDTVVNGEAREFFNQKEIAHMEDVQDLFLKGIMIRRIAIGIIAVGIIGLLLMKVDIRRVLPRIYRVGTLVLLGLTCVIALVFSTNFTKYFTIFHEIFFTNDLWLLDPSTDLMINILPEGFFTDMSIRIVVFFIISLLLTLGVSVVVSNWNKIIKKN